LGFELIDERDASTRITKSDSEFGTFALVWTKCIPGHKSVFVKIDPELAVVSTLRCFIRNPRFNQAKNVFAGTKEDELTVLVIVLLWK
jgi:hypothetical protein